jgi:hypothetical protein
MQTLSGMMKNNATICTFWMLKNQQDHCKESSKHLLKGLTCHHFAGSFHLFFIPSYNFPSGPVRKKKKEV